jgi:NAD(P)-dependent dehydrogenase (short-subunit alcohol dehydrogenase family)
MSGELAGKVVAMIAGGSALDRAVAIACAEAGADLALATVARTQEEEFAMNSIANEAWALEREQFVTLLDSGQPTEVMAFAEETWDRYGRCDAFIAAHHLASAAPLDELSPDEWAAVVHANLTAPFVALHAFGRLMERGGSGSLVALVPAVAGADAAYHSARAGLVPLVEAINEGWGDRGVRAAIVHLDTPGADAARRVVEFIAG